MSTTSNDSKTVIITDLTEKSAEFKNEKNNLLCPEKGSKEFDDLIGFIEAQKKVIDKTNKKNRKFEIENERI